MAVITYCDACGKETDNNHRRIQIGKHIGQTEDMDYHPLGHPMRDFDLCGRCLNIVESASYEQIMLLREHRKNRDVV